MDKEALRSPHDLGGVSKFMCEPVDVEPHALDAFDRQVDALRHFRRTAGFRIAFLDLTGHLPLMIVSDRLTDVAGQVVEPILA